MKKLLSLFLVLCMCLCVVLTGCRDKTPPPEPEPTPVNPTDLGEKKGEVHYTTDPGGSVEEKESNEKLPDEGIRYEVE